MSQRPNTSTDDQAKPALRQIGDLAGQAAVVTGSTSGIGLALARAGGVVAQAAADLGLSRQALYRRMERLGIVRP